MKRVLILSIIVMNFLLSGCSAKCRRNPSIINCTLGEVVSGVAKAQRCAVGAVVGSDMDRVCK